MSLTKRKRFANPTTVDPKPLVQRRAELEIATNGQRMIEITTECREWIKEIAAFEGLLTIFVQHTSASLTIQENADPDVQRDLLDALNEFAPESPDYRHNSEGPDDMPAHIKAMLTSINLSIPVISGQSALGTWQGVYLLEHRLAPHSRSILLHFVGSCEPA